MKFRIFSDLHIEFSKFKNFPKEDCKDIVLILAGDIGVSLMARSMVEVMCKYYKDVIYVAGNHEYYNQCMQDVDARLHALSNSIPNLHFLQNQSVIIDGVRIIGGTMWTDLNKGDWFTCHKASTKMNDYSIIKYIDNVDKLRTFETRESRRLFSDFKEFLSKELSNKFTGQSIVVTHHAPSEMSVTEMYKGNTLNYAYYEDMSEFMFLDSAPILWAHGHMHNSSDYTIGNTRVIANPRGYAPHHINSSFDNEILLTL